MERDTAPRPPFSVERPPSTTERPPSVEFGPPSPPRRPALRALVGLALAACIVVAALVLQSSYGGGAKLVVARWEPQLVSTPSLPPENPSASRTARCIYRSIGRGGDSTTASIARGAGRTTQDAPPKATAALPIRASCCKRWRATSRNWQRNIEQLKANQQQIAGDNSKAIEELKASQEETKTGAREGFRAEPAQGVTASDAAGCDLAQARADGSGAATETPAASNLLEGVDLRRLRLVDHRRGQHRSLANKANMSLHNTSAASPAVS